MKNQPKKRGLLKALSTVAASAMIVLGAGVAANAAPTIPDPDANGSINIQKMSQPTSAQQRANGLEKDLSASGAVALPGATFTVQQVDADTSTNEGWIAAAEMSVEDAQAALLPGTLRTLTTDADGRVTFGNNSENASWALTTDGVDLPIGLYLVTETVTPEGYIGSAPFLMTVPLTHPENRDNWMYDVYVYPKNSNAPVKTVDDGDAVDSNDDVVWTIKSSIPLDGDVVTGYAVADVLDPRLDHTDTAVALEGSSGVTLGAGDYTITDAVSGNNNTMTVVFTPQGLGKLTLAVKGDADAVPAVTGDPNTKVVVTVTTRVNSIGDGEIPNEAVIYDNKSKVDWLTDENRDPECEIGDPECDPGTPTDDPETKWGAVNFDKKKADGDKGALAGAVFSVFDQDPTGEDQAWLAANALTAFNANGDPATTFTSAADGTVVIEGLRYSRWANDGPIDENDPAYVQYWLVEIESPDGYELLANPINFEVNSPNNALVVDGAALSEVVNVPHNAGFELPLTGGTGTLLITIIGGAVLAFVLIAGRRKSAAHKA